MKSKRRELTLVKKLTEDAKQKALEVFDKIKPDIDRAVEAINRSQEIKSPLTYHRLTPPISNYNISQESHSGRYPFLRTLFLQARPLTAKV